MRDLAVNIDLITGWFPVTIVIVAIAEPSIGIISLAIGLGSWPTIARLVRAEFRSLRERDFVVAAQGLGYSSARSVFQ